MKKIVFVAAAMFLSFSLAFVGLSSVNTPPSVHAATTPVTAELTSVQVKNVAVSPKTFPWGAVIKIFTSKPGCEAQKAIYNAMFPKKPKLRCVKSGKVWLLTR